MRRAIGMGSLIAVAIAIGPLAPVRGDEQPFTVYADYFESNQSGLKGDVSRLAIQDRKEFDSIFGLAVVMGRKPVTLPENAFESRLVLAVIHRGKQIFTYKVQGVSTAGGVLSLRYSAEAKDGGGANFASPLIVAVPKGKYTAVRFIENGKQPVDLPVAK